ncbi:MAG TPA: hypothetical protein VIU35_06880 [Chitinophagaceae bacterium]
MTNLRNLRIPLAVAAVAITSVFILSSWDFKNTYAAWNDNDYDNCDTIPKKEKKIRDLDDVIDELNAVDFKMDMEKMQKELNESMKKLDLKKMQFDMEKSMHDVDFQKIQKEIERSMAKIDFPNIEKEMANAMKEFDATKIQKEVQESMQKIEWDKMKIEFDKVKDIDMKKMQLDMEKMQAELSKIGPEIEKSLENAKVEIEKAKIEMKEYKEFVDGLERDGLINKKEEYTIKHDNGELIINGKKASDSTYKKYKPFLDKRKKFTIEKSDDDFNIDID